MRDDNTMRGIEHGESARHRLVIRETPVSMKFGPPGETSLDVIERERPLHVTGDLHALPRAKTAVNFAARVAQLRFDRLHFGIKIDIVLARMRLQILKAPFQFEDRFFEIERLQ